MNCRKKIDLTALLAVIFILAAAPVCCAAEAASDPQKFELQAERLTYVDATGIASAEGNVRARHLNMRMNAPYVQYDTKNEVIKAFSDSRNNVTMTVDNTRLTGQTAEFNTLTREGHLTHASGKMDALYMQGDSIRVMPYEEAVNRKLVSGQASAKARSDDMVALSQNVSVTTCNFSNPHYKIVSDKMVVIPGVKTIIRTPKLYMGERLVFTYPFDYIIVDGKQKNSIAPYLDYDSDLGLGIGIQGPFAWDSGQIDTNFVYWTKDEWEARLGITQSLGPYLSVFAESNRLYNKDDDEIMWRPQWGLKYEKDGWLAVLRESQRELIENEIRPGYDRRYSIWRKPELQVRTPAYPFSFEGIDGTITLEGIYGRYQDNMDYSPWTNRTALSAYSKGTFMTGAFEKIRPFYWASYHYYDYDDDFSSKQKVTNLMVGFYWNIGEVNLGTAYGRRWVSGESPLYWDRAYDREDIYQMLSFTLPGGSEWEKWNFAVQAGYDLDDKRIGEMLYKIAYIKHCLTFELFAVQKTPKQASDEFRIGLRFIINAYPQESYRIGEPDFDSPFEEIFGTNENGTTGGARN